MQIDIELALLNASLDQLKEIENRLPPGFIVEDRTDRGWGLVICIIGELPDDVSGAISDFLQQLSSVTDIISSSAGIMRVGVFHNTANCTMEFNCLARLNEFGLSLEISTYPSMD